MACKKAELEEKNYDIEEIDEFLKINEQGVEIKEDESLIDFEKLPKIYKFGYDFIRRLNIDDMKKMHQEVEEESENEAVQEEEEAEEENIEEEDCQVLIDAMPEEEEKQPDENLSFVITFTFYEIEREIGQEGIIEDLFKVKTRYQKELGSLNDRLRNCFVCGKN